jgi:hypothetical protein
LLPEPYSARTISTLFRGAASRGIANKHTSTRTAKSLFKVNLLISIFNVRADRSGENGHIAKYVDDALEQRDREQVEE